ncbi:MAG: SDR family NAD(P)-dependent oxidoreductase, partial [Bacteroidota bacterium]
PNEDLPQLAQDIHSKFKVDVKILEKNLAHSDAAETVFEWTQEEGLTIQILVNNAGMGTLGPFHETDVPKHKVMLALNMDTPYLLSRYFLPGMLALDAPAYIMNMTSQAAFFPIPYKATYGATKVFLHSISNALQFELRGTNVHVCSVTPSGVLTNDDIRKRIAVSGFWGRISAFEPEDIARMSVRGMLRKKRTVIPGVVNKLTYFLSRVLPIPWSMWMAEHRFKKDPEMLEAKKIKDDQPAHNQA